MKNGVKEVEFFIVKKFLSFLLSEENLLIVGFFSAPLNVSNVMIYPASNNIFVNWTLPSETDSVFDSLVIVCVFACLFNTRPFLIGQHHNYADYRQLTLFFSYFPLTYWKCIEPCLQYRFDLLSFLTIFNSCVWW